jgi:hypothetical protein
MRPNRRRTLRTALVALLVVGGVTATSVAAAVGTGVGRASATPTALFSSTTAGTYAVTVPDGVTSIGIVAVGGSGGSASCNSITVDGGRGAVVSTAATVLPGDTLTVTVASDAESAIDDCLTFPQAAGSGSGAGGDGNNTGTGGGGASAVSDGAGALAVAGGGGGGGFFSPGGDAGASVTDGGQAGGQRAPGPGGPDGGAPGVGGQGGSGTGAGGGGGYFGGGSGGGVVDQHSGIFLAYGGGGGSSFPPAAVTGLGGQPSVTITYGPRDPQTLSFTSTYPSPVYLGGPDYSPTVQGGGSANPVVVTLDASSTGCVLVSGVVSFPAAGTCVIDADQAGNAYYDPAPEIQQVIVVEPFGVATSVLPTASPGVPYGPVTLEAGGESQSAPGYVTTVSWKGVALPKGMVLGTDGDLSGTPSARRAAPTSVTVRVVEVVTVITRRGRPARRKTTAEATLPFG